MTKGRVVTFIRSRRIGWTELAHVFAIFIPLGGPQAHDNSVEKHFPERASTQDLSTTLRSGRDDKRGRRFRGERLLDRRPFFITLRGPRANDSSVQTSHPGCFPSPEGRGLSAIVCSYMSFTPFDAFFLLPAMIALQQIGHGLRLRRTTSPQSNAIEGAVFALFGLLLAFTFSGAVARYDAHRELVSEERNDIGTAYLRLDLLPPQDQPPLRQLFRDYVISRLHLYDSVSPLGIPGIGRAAAGDLAEVSGCGHDARGEP